MTTVNKTGVKRAAAVSTRRTIVLSAERRWLAIALSIQILLLGIYLHVSNVDGGSESFVLNLSSSSDRQEIFIASMLEALKDEEGLDMVDIVPASAFDEHTGDGVTPAALKELVSSPDGVIPSNPTEHPMCRNALLDAHGLDKEMIIREYEDRVVAAEGLHNATLNPKNLPPNFWSRESLAAMQAPSGSNGLSVRGWLTFNYGTVGDDSNNGAQQLTYINIAKCGSSTVNGMLKKLAAHHGSTFDKKDYGDIPGRPSRNVRAKGDCTFTFVRDPLHRLVSGYLTANLFLKSQLGRRISGEAHKYFVGRWSFLNVTTEPERFRTFVRELKHSSNEFTSKHPLQQALSIGTTFMLFLGTKIHFIGRTEQLEEHWRLLSNSQHCRDLIGLDEKPLQNALPRRKLFAALEKNGLGYLFGNASPEENDKLSLPQYKEIMRDQKLFDDIVEHYWQDYVCFGYRTDYPELGRQYTGAFKRPY